jgi:hypothetical protein
MNFINSFLRYTAPVILGAILILLSSCETNPPIVVDYGSGNIFLNINLNTSGSSSASKIVLLEDFANVSCVPCVISNKIIESLTKNTYGPSKLVAVKFPTNFPSSSDPFYLAKPDYCDQRMDYYNIFFAPTTYVDGVLRPASTDSTAVIAAVDERLATTPRFEIQVKDSVGGENYFITISLNILNSTGLNLDEVVLHTVVTETEIEFETPPGSNGETKFYDVMRDMLPTNLGETLSNIIQTGEIDYQFEEVIFSNWNLSHLNVVAYIQDISTKEVYQAGSTFE